MPFQAREELLKSCLPTLHFLYISNSHTKNEPFPSLLTSTPWDVLVRHNSCCWKNVFGFGVFFKYRRQLKKKKEKEIEGIKTALLLKSTFKSSGEKGYHRSGKHHEAGL